MLTTEAARQHAIKGVMVCVAACLLSACAVQTGVCGKEPTGKLTYYIASIREKKIQGNWGERTQWVQRQETADGRWALETLGLSGTVDGMADAKMLDSTGTVVWERRIGDAVVLSPVGPAFAAGSSEGGGLEIYNIQVGPNPLFSVPPRLDAGVHVSRDGTVFGIAVANVITIVTLRGEVLGRIPAPDSLRGVSIAIADSGRYVAFGGADPRAVPQQPTGGSAADTPHRSTPVELDAKPTVPVEDQPGPPPGPRDRPQDVEFQPPTMPGANPRIIVMDRTGKVVGEIRLGRGLPRDIAMSGDDPPNVAVATGSRVSLWTCAGRRIWVDSLSLVGTGRSLTTAISVSDGGRVFALMAGSMSDAAFYVWGKDGILESEIILPENLDPLPGRSLRPPPGDSSIVIDGGNMIVTVRERAQEPPEH